MRGLIQRFFMISLMVCFIIAISLGAYSANGGPAWAYWLGNIIRGALITIVGLILMIGSATSIEFVRKLHSLHNPYYEVNNTKRFLWIAVGLLLTLFGGSMFLYTVSQNPNCRYISC